jgi:hypothetical protein
MDTECFPGMSGSAIFQNGKVVGIISYKVDKKTYSPYLSKDVVSKILKGDVLSKTVRLSEYA